MHDGNMKLKFAQLRAEGKSYDVIAKDLNVSKPTLLKWGKEMLEEISEYKKIFIEEKLEYYKLSLVQQMELYSSRLSKLQEHIGKRNFGMFDERLLIDSEIKYLSLSLKAFKPFLYPAPASKGGPDNRGSDGENSNEDTNKNEK